MWAPATLHCFCAQSDVSMPPAQHSNQKLQRTTNSAATILAPNLVETLLLRPCSHAKWSGLHCVKGWARFGAPISSELSGWSSVSQTSLSRARMPLEVRFLSKRPACIAATLRDRLDAERKRDRGYPLHKFRFCPVSPFRCGSTCALGTGSERVRAQKLKKVTGLEFHKCRSAPLTAALRELKRSLMLHPFLVDLSTPRVADESSVARKAHTSRAAQAYCHAAGFEKV